MNAVPSASWIKANGLEMEPVLAEHSTGSLTSVTLYGCDEDVHVLEPEPLPGDINSLCVISVVRDVRSFCIGTDNMFLRSSRLICTSLFLCLFFVIQAFLIYETKHLVTPESVHSIRTTYGKFEEHMYTDDNAVSHTFTTKFGHKRGIDGFFNAPQFATLSDDLKHDACRIPFSQPSFLFTILLLWSLTVFAEVRSTLEMAYRLIVSTPTTSHMEDSVVIEDESVTTVKTYIVKGLPCAMKGLLGILVILPRVLMSGFLLYLGCRWLVSTTDFGDLLLNAVALEFILCLKDLLFVSVVPAHLQREVENTKVEPVIQREVPGCGSFFGMFSLFVVAVAWVFLYMLVVQQVLPEYKWDVHEVCTTYIEEVMGRT